MKSILVLMFSFLVVLVGIFTIFAKFYSNSTDTLSEGEVVLGGKAFSVSVADSDDSRESGLSRHVPLQSDQGMFFIFEKEGDYGFWMKDMLFSIDILWIDKDFKINHIERGARPESFPKVFSGGDSTLYVLEISAGESDRLDIKTGDKIKFIKNR